jgi:Fur family ferric uptake transcriptional regulator
LNSSGHKSLAQIYAQVVKTNPKIGFTTVYRTLKLLTRLGLATQRKFGDGETRYEPTSEGSHHDHLICLECGKIIEFENPALEALQDGIAQRHHFKISHHRMEIYGRCEECDRKKKTGRRKS